MRKQQENNGKGMGKHRKQWENTKYKKTIQTNDLDVQRTVLDIRIQGTRAWRPKAPWEPNGALTTRTLHGYYTVATRSCSCAASIPNFSKSTPYQNPGLGSPHPGSLDFDQILAQGIQILDWSGFPMIFLWFVVGFLRFSYGLNPYARACIYAFMLACVCICISIHVHRSEEHTS